jgi:hypothetical protein
VTSATVSNLTVKAPFIVTTDDGRPILSVFSSPPQLNFFADSGIVATIGEENGGGFIRASSTKNAFSAVMAVPNVAPQFALHNAKGVIGVLYAGKDGKSSLTLRNVQTGFNTVALSQGARGDGILQLMTAAGDLRVEAGVNEDGLGLVRVGPQWSCVVKMGILAPACIKGHK